MAVGSGASIVGEAGWSPPSGQEAVLIGAPLHGDDPPWSYLTAERAVPSRCAKTS